MQIGIDSFAAALTEDSVRISESDRLNDLIEQIKRADQAGLDTFGIGNTTVVDSSTRHLR
jgi:hypothetical protein